ncbi:DNA cytosine methyltransferase [Neopusillimonas aromaticivorans]|uniref:DNA cytosine methyltransferase n=1 Tax=Neopusillimonas aromaticivorans TaxID=2979868 RepID=UPI0033164487
MHEANHPQTKHYCESVWDVNPLEVTQGRPVGLAWFSPDCKHFSKAKGGKPVEKKIRGLAWIVMRWAALVRPRVIMLENVEEFKTWGPLTEDGRPCPSRKGKTFRSFVHQLQEKGYAVETRELRACDYGAPTIRKRLFMIARCDGQPIVWPEPTHGAPDSEGVKAKRLKPWRTAADCIDWSLPCPSIFERAKPLADNTMKRIARGLKRYVLDSGNPFIVKCNHTSNRTVYDCFRGGAIDEPVKTITASHGMGLAVPYLVGAGGPEYAGKPKSADTPFNTLTTENHTHLVTAFLAKHFGGNYTGSGADLAEPAHTVTAADHHALVTSHLAKLRNNQFGQDNREPVPTLTAGGGHVAEVRAFLVKYYSEGGQDQDCREPMHTIPTKDRLGLVTVAGQEYQIADIGMRMLEPHELYAAQGFPGSYIIAPTINGKQLPKHAQVRMCGNSVCPPLAAALVGANVPEMAAWGANEKHAIEALVA